jgi:hypothetical protein
MKTSRTILFVLILSFSSSTAVFAQIHAMIGSVNSCAGDLVIVPIQVENFSDVTSFRLNLICKSDYLDCSGFTNINPLLANNFSASIDQVSGGITLEWQSPTSQTFPGTETICELVFTTNLAGDSLLVWSHSWPGYFLNSASDTLPADFINGHVVVNEIPGIDLPDSRIVCIGETVTITGVVSSSNPPVSIMWTYPGGQTQTSDLYFAPFTLADSGNYTLLALDATGCSDQKTIHLLADTCQQGILENKAAIIDIFPNPCNGKFEIRIPEAKGNKVSVKITNTAGIIVFQKNELSNTSSGQAEINLPGLPDGVYIIEAFSDGVFARGKLIIRESE